MPFRRYLFKRPQRRRLEEVEDDYEAYMPYQTAHTVYEQEDHDTFTGLYGPNGDEIHIEREPIGFDLTPSEEYEDYEEC